MTGRILLGSMQRQKLNFRPLNAHQDKIEEYFDKIINDIEKYFDTLECPIREWD